MLDNACHESSDLPDGPSIIVSSRTCESGRGCPRVHINPSFLQHALTLRGLSRLAPIFHCSARTIRRRALESGIATPGTPLYTTSINPDGGVSRTYIRRPPRNPGITDNELDAILSSFLETFPRFGRRMLAGALKGSGIHVSRERIASAFLRINGTPGRFGEHTIHRRTYNVAGANSLWHHDGQHGVWQKYSVTSALVSPASQD
jgi:hypothetical protein